MGNDLTCDKCGYFTGHPNKMDKRGNPIFICKSCENGWDNSTEIAEARLGA